MSKNKIRVKFPNKKPKKQRKNRSQNPKQGYNYNKPFWAQELPDEWDDYAWSADDF
ncbi:hypothetical protein U9K52_08725 [Chryseobacterium sp. MHB01]|uniref:hypothetical protein n=1 Tax=Chryseobacterium sp. MHB01 TaxID=3109433 RepID=UPI002B0000EE|nr:hypothetical protein [Chryseobacterium sp. MHB01]MEA1848991.1 hypothetical protein [Chryseobacterium sp. MHB01]